MAASSKKPHGRRRLAPRATKHESALDPARLYAEHRSTVRRHLSRIVPGEEVEDLVQEVFAKAARAIRGFRAQSSVATWLMRIASRTAIDHLRSRRHHEVQHTIPIDTAGAGIADDEACGCGAAAAVPAEVPGKLVRSEMHACLREYVERLPREYAEVLTLKDLDGLTNTQIAAGLGISLDTAKIRLHRARTAMRTLLDEGCEFYRTEDNTLACDRKAGRR